MLGIHRVEIVIDNLQAQMPSNAAILYFGHVSVFYYIFLTAPISYTFTVCMES